MTTTSAPRSVTARRTGYVFGVVVNAVMLVLTNVWPGWAAVPFLTGDASRVLVLVNLTIVAGLLTDLVYLSVDPPDWSRSADWSRVRSVSPVCCGPGRSSRSTSAMRQSTGH